jgi:uncharacterized repeat protein (TIGR01451 family)
MTDTLPASLSYVSHTAPADWTCTNTTSELKCKATRVFTPNEVIPFTITVKVADVVAPIVLNKFKIETPEPQNTTNDEVTTENPGNNPPIAYDCDLGAHQQGKTVNIKATIDPCLKGTDPDNDAIVKYIITKLPDPTKVILTLQGVPVTLNQELTSTQKDQLEIKPVNNYVGIYDFQYTVEEARGLRDLTPATVKGSYFENDIVPEKVLKQGETIFVPGSLKVYELTVKNDKPTVFDGTITMTDTLPASLSYVSHTAPADWTCTNTDKSLTCKATRKFSPNEVIKFSLTVKVADVVALLVENKFRVDSPEPQNKQNDEVRTENPGNNPPVAYDCDLGAHQQGTELTILTTKNPCLRGTDPDNDAIVKYIITKLPDPTKVILHINGTPVTLNQELTEAQRDQLKVKPVNNYLGQFDFQYTVEDARGLRDLTPATVKGEYFTSDIIPEKVLVQGATIFVKGETKVYNLKVVNAKSTPFVGKITMTDKLPSSLTYVSHTAPSDWVCTSNPQELKCEATRTFAPNEVVPFTITVKVADVVAPIVENKFRIDTPEPQNTQNDEVKTENPGNNPPEAYDCDLGSHQQGKELVLLNVKNPCLRGTDPDNDAIVRYIITRLPSPTQGILYVNNTQVQLNDELPEGQRDALKFVPAKDFIGKFDFDYTVLEARGLKDLTPATVFGNYYDTDIVPEKVLKQGETMFIPGALKVYELTVKNDKPNPFTGTITMTDTLPQSLSYVAHTAPADWTCTNTDKKLTCKATRTFASNEVIKFSLTVKVADVVALLVENKFRIDTPEPQNTQNDETKTENPGNNPPVAYDCDLGRHQQGEELTILTVKNPCLRGTDPDNDAIVKYIITTLPDPSHVILHLNGTPVTLNQELTESQRDQLKIKPVKDYVGFFDFQYTVEDARGLRDLTPATVVGEYYPSNIKVLKELENDNIADKKILMPGKEYTYIINVVNDKSDLFTGTITMTDTLPNSLSYKSHQAPTGWNCTTATKELKCNITKTFKPKEVNTFKLVVSSIDLVDRSIINEAKITTDKPQDNLEDDEVTVENPGNNPPETYDCDLGRMPAGTKFLIKDIVADCLQATDPDILVGPANFIQAIALSDFIKQYEVTKLPDPLSGTIYFNNIPVTLGQIFQPGDENNMTFEPLAGYVGPVTFRYTAYDSFMAVDESPAKGKGEFYPNDISIIKEIVPQNTIFTQNLEAEYKITVKNEKADKVKGKTQMIDKLPDTLEFVAFGTIDADWKCTNVKNAITCDKTSEWKGNEIATIGIKVKVKDMDLPSKIENTAEVITDFPEEKKENNKSTVITPVAEYDLAIVKKHKGDFKQGDKGTYILTVSNTTDYEVTTPITVTDELPKGFTVDKVVVPNIDWLCNNTETSIKCIAQKGMKGKVSNDLELIVNISKEVTGKVTNTATVETPRKEKTYENNKSSDDVTIIVPALPRTGGPESISLLVLLTTLISILVVKKSKEEKLN